VRKLVHRAILVLLAQGERLEQPVTEDHQATMVSMASMAMRALLVQPAQQVHKAHRVLQARTDKMVRMGKTDHRGYRDQLALWGRRVPRVMTGPMVKTDKMAHKEYRAPLALRAPWAVPELMARMVPTDRMVLRAYKAYPDQPDHKALRDKMGLTGKMVLMVQRVR
jgi:hypothetical protein